MKQLEMTSIVRFCQLVCSLGTYSHIIALLSPNSVHHKEYVENGVC